MSLIYLLLIYIVKNEHIYNLHILQSTLIKFVAKIVNIS